MVKIQAKPFDVDLTKVYVNTSDNSDNEADALYNNIESTLKYTKPSKITMPISTQRLEIRKNTLRQASESEMKEEIGQQNCGSTKKSS